MLHFFIFFCPLIIGCPGQLVLDVSSLWKSIWGANFKHMLVYFFSSWFDICMIFRGKSVLPVQVMDTFKTDFGISSYMLFGVSFSMNSCNHA